MQFDATCRYRSPVLSSQPSHLSLPAYLRSRLAGKREISVVIARHLSTVGAGRPMPCCEIACNRIWQMADDAAAWSVHRLCCDAIGQQGAVGDREPQAPAKRILSDRQCQIHWPRHRMPVCGVPVSRIAREAAALRIGTGGSRRDPAAHECRSRV